MMKQLIYLFCAFLLSSCDYNSKTSMHEEYDYSELLLQEIELVDEIEFKFSNFLSPDNPILFSVQTTSNLIEEYFNSEADIFPGKLLDSVELYLSKIDSNCSFNLKYNNLQFNNKNKFVYLNEVNNFLLDYYFEISKNSYNMNYLLPIAQPNNFNIKKGDTQIVRIFLAGVNSYNELSAILDSGDSFVIDSYVPSIKIIGEQKGNHTQSGKLYFSHSEYDFVIKYSVQ